MSVALSLESITCHSKTNKERYADYLMIILRVRIAGSGVALYSKSVIVGNYESKVPFNNGAHEDFTTQTNPPGQVYSYGPGGIVLENYATAALTASDLTVPFGESGEEEVLDIELHNIRDVSDPYMFAKVMAFIGSFAAGVLASYGVSQVAGDLASRSVLDVARDAAVSRGASSLFGDLLGYISDVFAAWPECAGVVLLQTLPAAPNGRLSVRTDGRTPGGGGCNRPDYEAVVNRYKTSFDNAAKPSEKRRCEYVPYPAETVDPWLSIGREVYRVEGFHEFSSAINVTIRKHDGGANSVLVSIREEAASSSALDLAPLVNGTYAAHPTISPVKKRPHGVKFQQGDFRVQPVGHSALRGVWERAYRLVGVAEPIVNGVGRRFKTLPMPSSVRDWLSDAAEDFQRSDYLDRGPLVGSVIEIPELDIRLELHRKACYLLVEGKKDESSAVYRHPVIFYWRGYGTPDKEGGSASDSRALLVGFSAPN